MMKKILLTALAAISYIGFAQVNCENEIIHEGEGTYYFFEEFGGFGNCSFDDTQIRPFLIGAMNEIDYAMADYCGACVEIEGPNGNVKVQIIDRCPECAPGDIDLSPEAFDYLAPRIDGRIPISWKVVPCEVTGPVVLYYKEGSNQWWTAIQVRNHRNPIEKLEFWDGTKYVDVPRQKYNYFLKDNGMGPGPHQFRITDSYGNEIVEENIPFTLETEIEGKSQFPKCLVTDISKEIALVHSVQIGEDIVLVGEGNYQLINATGKIVQSGLAQNKISTTSLKTGLYLLKAEIDNKVIVQRILVK